MIVNYFTSDVRTFNFNYRRGKISETRQSCQYASEASKDWIKKMYSICHDWKSFLTDTGENVQKWTRVFSTRGWVIHPPPPLKERWNLILLRSLRGAPFLKDYFFSPRVKNIFNDLKIFKIFRAFQKCYNLNDCAFSFQDIRHIRAARDQ